MQAKIIKSSLCAVTKTSFCYKFFRQDVGVPLERSASKRGTALIRSRYFIAINLASVKTIADKHRLATYHKKHCW